MTERDRSFWGWGWADRALDEQRRRELAERFETELGFPERPLLPPPELDAVTVPEPSLTVPDEIADFVSADRETRVKHTYGRAYRDLVRGFHGDFDAAPDAVARPQTEDQIESLLEWATEASVAVVPYGGGTSVVGGVEPVVGDGFEGVVTLSLRGLSDLLAVDETSRRARLQAGMTGPEVNDALETHDLQLRHYPQSYEFSTVGGWIATRAGGHFATVYTHIDDFVENVRAITPVGPLETLAVPASGAGPDPNSFLLGSEGAFGAITSAWLRVQPRPTHRAKATVRFSTFEDGVAATREIAQSRLYPANCRLLDPTEAMINEVAMDGSSVLVLGFESLAGPVEDQLQQALAICDRYGGTRSTADDEESNWRESFIEAPYLFNALVSIGVMVDTFETAVTWERFPTLHEALTTEVPATLRDVCGGGLISCRFTHVYEDGPAPYYTVLAPVTPGDELEQWRSMKQSASTLLSEHGATITHHHAVGRTHRPWYEREVPDQYLRALRSMKRTLDPAGVMNPGSLLTPPQG